MTKGYLSVPNLVVLRDKWQATQLGHLVNDPVMKPFVEDLQRQLKARLDRAGGRIGLVWDDIEGVYSGELCVAAVQPWNVAAAEKAILEAGERAVSKATEAKQNAQQVALAKAEALATARQEQDKKRQEQHALVLLVDVTDHVAEANALITKITDDLMKDGAKKSAVKLQGVDMTAMEITVQREGKPAATHTAYYCIHQDLLLATDHEAVADGILKRLAGDTTGALAASVVFETTMAQSRESIGEVTPHIKWFVEPFGMVEVLRGMNGGRQHRGTDLLKVLANQGFTAVQGLGGYLALATDKHEMLYSAHVHAPPVTRQEGDKSSDKYNLAARMLNFPNVQSVQPPAWAPRELATYLTFNWKLQDAFRYSETLVNEYAGDEAVFRDVLKSIETDPNGPMLNLEKELIAHLGERVILFADCRIPVTPKSERVMVAISLTNPEAVRQTINKAMESDPEAHRRDHNGHIIWEMIAEEAVEVETVQIDGPGFGFEADDQAVEEEEKPFRPNGAITVTRDHLVVATHVDYLEELIDRPDDAESLVADGEYKLVEVALDELGAGDDSFRLFSRTDEAYRSTYELVRQGKMPEAESLFGKLLNRVFEPAEEGAVREQFIDGAKLPDYDAARRYLGPAGFYVRSVDNGWSITGCLMNRQAP